MGRIVSYQSGRGKEIQTEDGSKRRLASQFELEEKEPADTEEMPSPLSKSLQTLIPRKAEAVIGDIKEGMVEWKSEASLVGLGDRTITIEAEKLEWFLYAFSNRVISNASSILVKLLQRPTMGQIKDNVLGAMSQARMT